MALVPVFDQQLPCIQRNNSVYEWSNTTYVSNVTMLKPGISATSDMRMMKLASNYYMIKYIAQKHYLVKKSA